MGVYFWTGVYDRICGGTPHKMEDPPMQRSHQHRCGARLFPYPYLFLSSSMFFASNASPVDRSQWAAASGQRKTSILEVGHIFLVIFQATRNQGHNYLDWFWV